MRHGPAALLVIAAVGCTPPEGGPRGGDGGTTTPTSPDDTSATPGTLPEDPTGDTGGGPPPWEMDVDCAGLLPLPLPYQVYDWVPPAEDFTFSADGYLIIASGRLTRTPFGGPVEVLIPNLGDARGTRFLPDGTLVVAEIDTGAVVNLDPATGARTVLASGLANPNGIAVGADGRVYIATSGRILRIDPSSGEVDVVVEMSGRSFDGLTFSPDYSRLYFNEELGRIHWIELDAEGTPGALGGPIAVPIGPLNLLDGMTVDACGNLYSTEMGGTVWRIDPAGHVERAVDLSEPLAVVPALNFGPAAGGWSSSTLYIMDFKGKLYAADVGVPGKWEPHH